jgi:hypothetical protein
MFVMPIVVAGGEWVLNELAPTLPDQNVLVTM